MNVPMVAGRPKQEEGQVLHMQYGDHPPDEDGVCLSGVRIASISPGADGMQSARPDISIRPREN